MGLLRKLFFFVCKSVFQRKGGVSGGAERKKTKTDSGQDAGRQSGKRSLNTGEPQPEKKAPRCPSWLEDEAKKEWKRMAKQLIWWTSARH